MAEVRCPACNARNRVRADAKGVPKCAACKAHLPWMVEADGASFQDEVNAAVPVVVDFWAPWCGPCRAVKPVLERLAATHAGGLKVVEVNVDDEPQLASRWGAMSIPLLVVLRRGQEVDRIVGVPPPGELERKLRPFIRDPGRA